MTWTSHRLTSFCLTYTVTGSFGYAGASVLFSILPDQLESVHHRGISHTITVWALLYVIIFSIIYAIPYWSFDFLKQTLVTTLFEIDSIKVSAYTILHGLAVASFFGIFSHLLTDGLSTSGIPWTPGSRKRFKLGWYKTWKFSESIVVGMFLIMAFVSYFSLWKLT